MTHRSNVASRDGCGRLIIQRSSNVSRNFGEPLDRRTVHDCLVFFLPRLINRDPRNFIFARTERERPRLETLIQYRTVVNEDFILLTRWIFQSIPSIVCTNVNISFLFFLFFLRRIGPFTMERVEFLRRLNITQVKIHKVAFYSILVDKLSSLLR